MREPEFRRLRVIGRDGEEVMFLRWRKAVFVIRFKWGRNERVESRMIPKLRM